MRNREFVSDFTAERSADSPCRNGQFSESAFPLAVLAEAIADTADGLNELAGRLELAAQRLHVNVDRAFQHDRPFANGGVHQLCAGESAAGLAEQGFQETEFGGRQV